MYYSAGTYESFAHPEKPEGVDRKSAYIIGTGLAGLSAAFYLVRDGQMKGERIHLLEKLELAGGSCDGRKDVTKGFYMRGGREMDNHFECMWDMFRDVPVDRDAGRLGAGRILLAEQARPQLFTLPRHRSTAARTRTPTGSSTLDRASRQWRSPSCSSRPRASLKTRRSPTSCPSTFWSTNFWLYWQTMFAFQRWSSALEMKRYLCRYVHHIDGLPDFSALRFTKYNQYESMILPLVKYLQSARRDNRIRHGCEERRHRGRGRQEGREARSSMSRTAMSSPST